MVGLLGCCWQGAFAVPPWAQMICVHIVYKCVYIYIYIQMQMQCINRIPQTLSGEVALGVLISESSDSRVLGLLERRRLRP